MSDGCRLCPPQHSTVTKAAMLATRAALILISTCSSNIRIVSPTLMSTCSKETYKSRPFHKDHYIVRKVHEKCIHKTIICIGNNIKRIIAYLLPKVNTPLLLTIPPSK
ncbi:hypothetical protein GIB67_025571 [Kingdonia uniflora]|uniref:Uncharacterized protein n=1 Tax=Kingdonia uniflora TaxID=39325 RepID=A0A7J7M0I5_9MAGN|nr:hypothetical protein GIB67_025571 [Kingdonia uniflora]